ncbi:hypothetical protein PC129_g11972 [Phytophthora cactorum]|nr:hypothetical protein Pcac1_g13310 [Phytophthora cactorum]KAG3217183.1 hypothetical protein PC129_g11972 [Phytophthora cactorum]
MLLPFLDTEDEAIAELLPFAAANRRLRDLLGELKDVESVSKALQGFTVGNSPSPIGKESIAIDSFVLLTRLLPLTDAFNPWPMKRRT